MGTLGVWEAVADLAAMGLGSVPEEPCVVCAARSLCGKRDRLPRRKDRRIDRKRGNGVVAGGKLSRLCAAGNQQRQVSVAAGAGLAVLDVVKGNAGYLADERGIDQRRLVERPDIAEGKAMQGGLLLLHLHQGVPVVEEEIFKGVVGVVALCVLRPPKAKQAKGLPAAADAPVQNVGVAQGEVA